MPVLNIQYHHSFAGTRKARQVLTFRYGARSASAIASPLRPSRSVSSVTAVYGSNISIYGVISVLIVAMLTVLETRLPIMVAIQYRNAGILGGNATIYGARMQAWWACWPITSHLLADNFTISHLSQQHSHVWCDNPAIYGTKAVIFGVNARICAESTPPFPIFLPAYWGSC
eukprot:1995742-Rhodomonas_salina.3